jgi:hypothetical protein
VTRTRLARATAAGLALAAFAAFAPAAQAGWSEPFQFAKPGLLDLIPAQLTFSPDGAAAAAFGVQDVDTPGVSQAYLTIRSAGGAVSPPFAIGSARQLLALAYDGSGLELITGTSPQGLTCCSAAQAVRLTAGGSFQRPRTLVGGLTGATEGQLLTLGDGGMLAAVATERGVWVVQSATTNRFGAQQLLTGAGQMPETLAAAGLGGQSTIVAWTAATGTVATAQPRSIYYAIGSRSGPPRQVRTLLTVPAGHRIDELGVARRGSGATAAWVQSWFDRPGNFHSEVDAADITAHAVIRRLSAPNEPASGVTIAGDAAGDQGIAWQSCRSNGSCTAQAALRSARAGFGRTQSLGPADPAQTQALTVGPGGQVIAGWVRGGQPVACAGSARQGTLGAVQTLSSSPYAHDLTVAFGPGRTALVGAAYTG